MTDRYQPLRDAIAARSWPVGDSFQRNMGLVEELLKERDALREALKPFAAIPLERIETPETFGMDVLRARAALADGEASNGS